MAFQRASALTGEGAGKHRQIGVFTPMPNQQGTIPDRLIGKPHELIEAILRFLQVIYLLEN